MASTAQSKNKFPEEKAKTSIRGKREFEIHEQTNTKRKCLQGRISEDLQNYQTREKKRSVGINTQ